MPLSQHLIWLFRLLILLPCLIFLSACSSHPPLPNVADYVDPDKFAGEWFIISNIPYFAEKGKIASKTNYRKRGPNKFDDIYESRDGSFDKPVKKLVGSVKSLNEQNTVWQSTFYWLLKFKFHVIHLDSKRELLLLGHPSRDYGWVMARTATIDDSLYKQSLKRFSDNGYDVSRFQKVPQLPEQLGQTGFQSGE